MSLEDNQFLLFDPGDGGASMEVPVRRESAFREKFPNARRLQLFDVGDGGEAMEVPEDRLDAFRAKYPKAERLYLFDEKDGGAAMEVPRAKLGAYIQKKAAPDKGGLTLRSGIRDAATAAVRVPAAAVAGAVQGVAGTLADLGPGDAARRERQRALDAAPERIPTMKEAGREVGLTQKEIDALPDRPVTLRDLDDPRFGQAYRDRVRATMNRVAANAPETEAEKAHREEAERLQAKSDKLSATLMEPRNAAERAAMHFGGGVATVGELGLASALGGPAAVPLWMGATGAAREAARQEAEGKTPREAMAGALAPAGAEALAWTVPVPVGQGATALGRVGREALTMGVKSDLAGTARRTLSGEEAPALSDRIAEDLGAAAMGGALGAAREGARAAGGAVVRAIEGDARNRAAKVAALDPTAALGKLQRRAEADYIDAQRGRAAEAAADLARMNPAGTVGRTADALEQASYALEALGRVEAGQRAAGAPPAPAGALPAPAEPGAVPTVYGQRTIVPPYYGPTVSRPGEPIAPPAPYADKVPEPIPETKEEVVRRRKEALDALPLPQRLKKTGFSAYYDQFPDRGAVLDAIGFENFAKLYRKYKGDFRNVTGDLVNAGEVGGIVGRDYSGADGVRRALEDAAQEYDAYRRWKDEGAPTAEEEMQTGQEVAWNKQQNADAEDDVRRRYELTHPEMTGEPRVTDEMIRDAAAAAEEGEVARIEAEAISEEPSRGGVDTPPRDFALDGGTPAEIDAEKARVAEAQKRAALEEQAAAPGKDLGTVTIQEGLPGIGGDGTLFTPPAGGWSGRRAGARADVAAETPRAAGAPAPESPHEGLRTKLRVLVDSGATPDELEAFAREAEASDAFATAALARQRAGTYRGTPWGTEGGNWPHAEPPAARASFGDLFALAKNLGDGKAPEFLRRISRLPWAEGVFRFREGDPKSGSIQQRSGLLRLVSDSQMEALRAEAQAEAESRGFGPERTAEEAQRIFSKKLRDTIRENAFAGPKEAMAVLAHEIGHWVDFLDEGTLKRGNVLGHIAALKRYMAKTLYETKGLADEAGWPGMTKEERAEIVKEAEKSVDPRDFEDNPAGYRAAKREARQLALEEAYTEMRLRAYPDVRREAQNLIAWYRQSDGMPDYFRNPSEMFAEAFSAWVNYPAEAAKRAPAFADLLENWLDARPEAARALREFRDGVTQAEARAAKAAGDVTNPAFFAALDQGSAAARRAEELAGRLTDQALAGRRTEDFWAKTKLALSGPDDILKGELMRSSLGAFNSHNLPLWRAMQQKDNANNRMVLWDYRFRTHVEPILHGVPRATFLNYLYHFRVAHELLGPDATRGRMNLPNAEGLTPGDVSRAEGNAQTSSAAWLNELRRTHPEIAEKCERARREFWNKVRNGGDELGGEGSPMDVIRNSPCLSAEQKAALLGNEAYVAFRPAVVPDVSRAVSTGEMSVWDGIFSQRTGSEKPVGDVLANTLLQDLTMQDQLLRQEYRLRAVDWLKANKAEWIGPEVPAKFDKATGKEYVPQSEKTGWRVVTFLRNGKPEGWWVRDFIADALAPKPHQVSALEGFRGFANKSARGINALKTTLNPAFGVANTLKDAFSIALRQLPRDTSGVGHARALLDGAANWLGDYGAMFRSFGDTSAADIVHGKWNPDAARALAWGALNNAAPNQSAYAGGGEKGGIGEMAARYRELGRSEISDKDLRAALKTFGYSEKQISGALDRTEAPLVRALKEAARVTGLRWAAGKHADVMSFLSRGEIRTKSFALAEAMRRNPGMTREEAVQWVHDMIGTPAMNNRPTVAKLPGIGHVVPFLTPRVHGWTDQLYGALRSGWTGGPGQSAKVASRLAFATTMMAIPLAAVSILRDEAEEAEKKGDKERADALRGMARRWQAIPSTDILTGICFPNPLGKNSHIKIPVDPTIVPLAGLALEKIFGGGGKNLAPGAGMEQFTGDLLPTVGTAPTLYLGNRSGRDPNTGRQVVGERTPGLDRTLWNWDQLTARGLGMLPGSMLRAWMAGSEDAREMERAGRADKIPVVSAFWRPFLRRSGYGLVERGNVMRDLNSAAGKRAQEIAERIAAGRPVSKADEDWFYENVTDPRSMVNSASGRLDALKTKTPDQRAAEALPAIRADAIEKAAGYIRPPRLTEEDRNR